MLKSPTSQIQQKKIAIFDLSITSDSPAGSCILQMLDGLCEEYSFIVFADRFDNPAPQKITWIRVPLPKKPVLLRYIIFKTLAPYYYNRYLHSHSKPEIIIATEGEFIKCDICYAHFCHQAYSRRAKIQASFLRKLARILNYKLNAKDERKAFTNSKIIVVPSQGLENELVETYGSLVNQKITTISNPINVNNFIRPASFDSYRLRTELGFCSEDFVIVFAALGDFERKGLKLLMQSLSTCRNYPIKLLVVGGSEAEIQEYKSIQTKLGLLEQVVFVGFQSDLRPYLWSSDIFALPSNYETFSLVTFQAAAASLPIMATQLYGVEELLQNEINGWLVERNIESISTTIQNAILNKDKLKRMGKAAHIASSRYDKSMYIANWRSALYSLYAYNTFPSAEIHQ